MCLPLLAPRCPLHDMKVTEQVENCTTWVLGMPYLLQDMKKPRQSLQEGLVLSRRPFFVSQESQTTVLDGVFLCSLSLLFR